MLKTRRLEIPQPDDSTGPAYADNVFAAPRLWKLRDPFSKDR